jgi:allantoin racemase
MKTLIVNPNTSAAVTRIIEGEACRSAAPGHAIVAVGARFGPQYVENRAEAAIAAHAVLEAIAEHAGGCDAVIVAAFGDPGVEAARELFDLPVVGISEAAFHFAYLLGRRYSVVCMTPRLRTWYLECAAAADMDKRLASIRALPTLPGTLETARVAARSALLEQCLLAIEEDDAEVLVVGGGPLAGLARELAPELPVPVIDGVSCAVRMVEALHGLAPRKAIRGSFARPAPKPAVGLAEPLRRRITGDDA